ncbi:rRNA maturation RNase YbeY [Schleiferiaceae bacterium]|nr:rRNA maturation RNase YbeY [Schleiferiaceae bacterium]MDB2473250.1 rRNA maturation RNase YbeY [Schleiferiaceae bacterium]PSR07790.1 MAG: rRNA maturation RNase YbeY [Bacteroidota bacterium]
MLKLGDQFLVVFKKLYADYRFGDIIIHWVNDDELLEMNNRFLNHNYYTDIITFDYSRGKKISGELFISEDRVVENANKETIPFEQERDRVIAHGVLHLLGFKDKTEQEQEEMRLKEDQFLKELYHGS